MQALSAYRGGQMVDGQRFERMRSMAEVLHAFCACSTTDDYAAERCAETLRRMGVRLCPWHWPVRCSPSAPNEIIDAAVGWVASIGTRDDITWWTMCWLKWIAGRGGGRGFNAVPWSLSTAGMRALLGSQQYEPRRRSSTLPAVGEGLRSALLSTFRLGGVDACDEFLIDRGLCTCEGC